MLIQNLKFIIPAAAVICGLVLTGCGAAGEAPATPAPVVEATTAPAEAAPTEPPTPEPTLAPTTTPVPTVVPTSPPAPTVEETAPPAPEAASAGETAAELRTFQIVSEESETFYQVEEEFFNRPIQFFNPIGRTQAIDGEFQLSFDGSQVQLADNQFTVDLRTLASDDPRRDGRIRDEWLESNTYPWAEFKATAIEDFPPGAAEGQNVSFKVTGDMTIREVTRPQTFDVTARLDGDTFTGTAITSLLMRDYGFEPPEILGMLKVTDGVTVTVNFVAREGAPGS